MYTSHLSYACGFAWGDLTCRACGLRRPVGGGEGENAIVNQDIH